MTALQQRISGLFSSFSQKVGKVRFNRADESAIVFCGSQKSVVSGIPIASALIAGPALGVFVLPVMIYHAMQLLVCGGLAKCYARRSLFAPGVEDEANSVSNFRVVLTFALFGLTLSLLALGHGGLAASDYWAEMFSLH